MRNGISAATRCEDCFGKIKTQQRHTNTNIPSNYSRATFENFSLRRDNPVAHQALTGVFRVVWDYARSFPATDKPGLLLVGETGTGKTHLAVAALKVLIERGFDGVFFDFNNLIDRIRASYDQSSGSSERETYRLAMDAEILLLDDLGAHRAIEWIEDILTSIITYRCNNRKPLIATTNLAEPDAGSNVRFRRAETGTTGTRTQLQDRIGNRARSRLFEMCHVIKMPDVEDYRVLSRRLEGAPH